MTDNALPGPLAGIRVIELASEFGAFAGRLLADFGAEVLVVEPPSGHPTRLYPPFADDVSDPERSLWWWYYHAGKYGVTCDVDDQLDVQRLRGLMAGSDIVIDAGTWPELEKQGLDADTVRRISPRLIWTSISPFGRGHPRNVEPALDLTLMAAGGPVWSCGYDDHAIPPVRPGGHQAHHTGSVWAVNATLAALLARDLNGRGQIVDTSIHASLNVTCEGSTTYWLVAGQTVQRQTCRHAWPTRTGPRTFRAEDGVYVTIGTPPRNGRTCGQLLDWLKELGLEDEVDDLVFLELGAKEDLILVPEQTSDPVALGIAGAAIDAITCIAAHLPAMEFFIGGQQRGLTSSIILTPDEAIRNEHLLARRFPNEIWHEDIGRHVVYPGAPFVMEASPGSIRRRAPKLGEHDDDYRPEVAQ